MKTETIGQKLIQLRKRSGLTLAQVAKAAGYAGPSSVQALFKEDYNPLVLSPHAALALADAFTERGTPPIRRDEVMALTNIPGLSEVRSADGPMPTMRGQLRDVPVFGTAIGADLVLSEDAIAEGVEQTIFELGEAITYIRRPPGLNGINEVYALFVSGSSMEPRYSPGNAIFVDPRRPPSIGDDVIVQLAGSVGDDAIITTGLVKTLVRRTSSHLELLQYSPAITFKIPANLVAKIHRVIPWNECFGF